MPRSNDSRALEDFTQAIVLLVRRIRAETPTEMHGLSLTQRAVLARLDSEGPMISADLARAEGIKPQSMFTVLSSLEELGVIERKRHPTDGRQHLLALTTRGKAIRSATRDAKAGWLNAALAQLDHDEREALIEAGKIIRRMVETS